MGGPGSGRYPPKPKESKNNSEFKEIDAVTWLKAYPEDIPLARENLAARDRGFANDDVRQLMAAICLRACIDYKKAIHPRESWTNRNQRTIKDCRNFFGGEIFQFFVNGMAVKDIEKAIQRTPEDAIKNIWKKMENKQPSKSHLKDPAVKKKPKKKSAKNTTPIIEERCDEQGSLNFA